MSTVDPRAAGGLPIEERLAVALRDRTRAVDTDLDGLMHRIVTAAADTPQRRSIRWRARVAGRGPRLLAVGVLMGATVGVAAVGAALRADASPPVPRHNGPIYVTGDVGEGWLTVDPLDGAVERARGMAEVTASPDRIRDLSWSPDGRRLAYSTPDGVFVVDLAIGSPVRIADCTALYPCGVAWSPDGARIAVSADHRVDLVHPDGRVEASFDVDAARHITEPAWSPDGAWIVYIDRVEVADDGAVRAVRPDGTDDHLVAAPAGPGAIAMDPAWSPDGTKVFYLTQVRRPGPNVARGRGDDRPDLQILSVAVTGREEVPSLVGVVGRCWCMGFRPSFAIAPDGSAYLVITQSMPVPAGGVANGLFLIDAMTLEARLLRPTFTDRVTWAPTGSADGGP